MDDLQTTRFFIKIVADPAHPAGHLQNKEGEKQMKKLLALILALVMVVGLVACGAKEETAAPAATEAAPAATEAAPKEEAAALPYEGVKLRFTVPILVDESTDKATWDPIIAAFAAETGAEVELIQTSYADLVTVQMTNLIGEDGADILYFGGGSEYDFYSGGYFADLDPYITAEDAANWMYYDGKMIDGQHVLVPFIGGACPRGIFVNLDMAKELGLELDPDTLTWDTMVEAAKKAVEAGYEGFYTPLSGNENAIIANYFNYVCSAGGSLTNAEGYWDFTSDAALEAMQFVYDMTNTHKIVSTVSMDAAAVIDGWINGEALFAVCNCASINSRNLNGDIAFEFDAYNMKGSATDGVFSTCDSWAINAASENKEAAAALLKYVLQPENYQVITKALDPSYFDCAVSGFDTSIFGEVAPCIEELMSYETAYWPPVAANSSQIKEALQTHQQLCAMGDETPEEALAAVQAVVDSLK